MLNVYKDRDGIDPRKTNVPNTKRFYIPRLTIVALALIYYVFRRPVVKLGCRESDEVGIWVVRVTGKN